MKYAWIDKMAGRRLWWFSVALACELLEVSRSGFYDWRARRERPATPRQRQEQLLVAAITVEHIASKRRYGSPRIHAELVDQGWQIGVNRVARLMRLHGIEGRSGRRRRHHLTRQAKVAPDIPDLLRRDFAAEQPDTKWTTDISYVPTAQGWVYVAVLLDLCSKAVVGWAADTHMRTSLILDALTMALTARQPAPGLIVHSDRGSQYTSQGWLDALAAVDAKASMGRVGVCWVTLPRNRGSGGSRMSSCTLSGRSRPVTRPSWRSPATSAGTTPRVVTRRWWALGSAIVDVTTTTATGPPRRPPSSAVTSWSS